MARAQMLAAIAGNNGSFRGAIFYVCCVWQSGHSAKAGTPLKEV